MRELVSELQYLEGLRGGDTGRNDISLADIYRQRVLTFDLETMPALAWIYQLRTTFIPHKSVLVPGGLLGFSYKWLEEDEAHWVDYRAGYTEMVTKLREILHSADFAIGYNSDRFDLPKSKGFIARLGLDPYSPPRSIDLLKTTKSMGWESASLDYSCRMMGLRRKVDNGGAGNWLGCVQGDNESWERMEEYGLGDTYATEELFLALIPWLKNPPHLGGYVKGEHVCPRCGGLPDPDEEAMSYHAVNTRYELFRCVNCSGYFRSSRNGKTTPTATVS